MRLAEVRGRRVAITEAPAGDALEAADWIAAHRLRPEVHVEDGLLVVGVGREVAYAELLDLTAELHTRL